MANIPGINYNIRQALDRLQLQASIYNEEFVQRLLLMFGHPDYFSDPNYGIVSQLNPTSYVAGDSGPLVLSANSSNPLTVDVAPGLGVTRSGMWAVLSDYVRQVTLADPSIGVQNVVYLRYILDLAAPALNDYQQEVNPVTRRPGTVGAANGQDIQIAVDTLDSWLEFTQSVRDDFIPLGVVTVQTSQDPISLTVSTTLSIDHTQDSFNWNRPWFSARDVAHRAQLGSGIPSAKNPHAISQNDLTVGTFTPLQLQLDHGMIVADDVSVPKAPGTRCQISIPSTSILTDTSGKTPIPNSKYVELTDYPVRLGRVWVESTDEDWAAEIVTETNRLVFPAGVPADESIGAYYTKVIACQPPAGNNEIVFATSNPTANELIIAGGAGYTQLSNTQEAFSDAQRFPMVYDIIVDNTGALNKTPQVVYCYKRLEAIGTSDDFTISLAGPARIICGLADASGSPTMSVKIHLYGTNTAGNSIDHLFEFDSTWVNPGPIPNANITFGALKATTEIFASLDQIIIEERSGDGPATAVMLWAAVNPTDTYDKTKDACHVARVMWDGLRMAEIRDKRIIGTTVRDFLLGSVGNEAMQYYANALGGNTNTIYFEDFFTPRYSDLIVNSARGTVEDVLPVNNMSKLRPGANGFYRTRALAVDDKSDVHWRVVLVPLKEMRTNFYWQYKDPPTFKYHNGTSWQTAAMSASPGLYNTYEVTLAARPLMLQVELNAAEYLGMMIFG